MLGEMGRQTAKENAMKRDCFVLKGVLAVLLVLLCAAPVFLSGCGSEKEEPPVPKAPAEPESPAAPETGEPEKAAAEPELSYGSDAPLTVPVLRLIPESAVVTMAFPGISSLHDTVTNLVGRYVPPEQVQAAVSEWTSEMAREFGVPAAETPMEVARMRGFDPDAPIGIYADVEEFVEAWTAAIEELAAEETVKADAESPANAQPEETAAAPQNQEKPAAPENPEEEAAPPPQPVTEDLVEKAFEIAVKKAPPALVVAWAAVDVPAAENSLRELYTEYGQNIGPQTEEQTIEVDGATIHSFADGRYAYVIVDERVFAGTSVPMVRACLGRVDAQPPTPYGTAAMPALRRDEAVMLLQIDRAVELFEKVAPALSKMSGGMQDAATIGQFIEKWKTYYEGSGLFVYTLAAIPAEDSQPPEVVLRTLLQRTPALDEFIGELRPLRLAPLMPEKTQLLLAQQVSDKYKEMLREQWLLSFPPEAREEGPTAQAFEGLNKALDLIGDEFAVAVAPTEVGLPGILIMLALTDAEQAKSFIGGFVPTTVAEEYKGVQILNVVYPIPMVTISMAYVGNDLVVGTDLPLIKTVIDRLKGETPPALFSSLDPPLDPDQPMQGVGVIQSQLLIDVVVPLSAFAGGLGEAQKPVDTVTDVVREFRAIGTVTDKLYVSRMTVYLK